MMENNCKSLPSAQKKDLLRTVVLDLYISAPKRLKDSLKTNLPMLSDTSSVVQWVSNVDFESDPNLIVFLSLVKKEMASIPPYGVLLEKLGSKLLIAVPFIPFIPNWIKKALEAISAVQAN